MSRVRITQRNRRAVDDSIPYPGNVNQPDRKFKKWDQYFNFKQTVNHELPDMSHEWQNDSHDDIGFGGSEPWGAEPTVPQVKQAADRAVKLSCLLLGSKVSKEVILRQANEFMNLGPKGLERSLIRFAKTQKLYAADESDEQVNESPAAEKAETDEKPADPIPATAAEETPAPVVPDEKAQADTEIKEEEKDTTTASFKKELEGITASVLGSFRTEIASLMKGLKKASEEMAEATVTETPDGATETDTVTAKTVNAEDAPVADEKAEADTEVEEEETDDNSEGTEATAADADEFQLSASTDFGMDAGNKDPKLASCFDDGTPSELPEPVARVAKGKQKKEGIKSLPGQPRAASSKRSGSELSDVWDDNTPDVNELFR